MLAPYESRIVEKFKVIRALAYQCEGQEAAEIQTLLGAAGQGYPEMQDPRHGWVGHT